MGWGGVGWDGLGPVVARPDGPHWQSFPDRKGGGCSTQTRLKASPQSPVVGDGIHNFPILPSPRPPPSHLPPKPPRLNTSIRFRGASGDK